MSNGDSVQGETRLWHSQAHMPTVKRSEIVIERSEGSYVFTEEGHRLLDVPASLWYCNVGHGRAEINAAVSAQMAKLAAYHSFQAFATRPALDVADRLADLAPVPDAKVYLGSGGGDGVEVAAKLARRYWSALGKPEKTVILSRQSGYHGLHGFGTSVGGLDYNRAGYGPLVGDVMRVDTHGAQALQQQIDELGADRVAAFFCEPVLGGGGVVFPKDGYLAEVQEICRANDVIFVVDEVITGFGRTGAMFASDRFGLTPDIMTFAKGVTSGYLPLGGAIISGRIAEPFWRDDSPLVFHQGITYSGHPTVCAAALANLDILESEDLAGRALSLEGVLARALAPLEDHPLVVDVRTGVGLLAGVQLTDDAVANEVARHCVENGVLMRLLANSTLQVSPPLIIEAEEIETMAAAIRDALDSVASAAQDAVSTV
jgi:adenosylmethionine-8-amino-7-oxononanoate aminotransferase